MSTEQNKALIRRFYAEVWGKGNLDVADEVFADDYTRHDLRPSAALPGPGGQKKIAGDFRAAFPDLQVTIDLLVGEADMVVARWIMEGTNTGQWGSTPATGKHVRFAGVNIWRFADGKVVEIWNHRDDLGLMQQLEAPVFAGSSR